MKKIPSVLLLLLASAVLTHAQVGAAKTGDPRVKALLEASDLKYTVDQDGDFKLTNGVEGDRTQVVWIISKTNTLGALEIREIWSIGYTSDTPISREILEKLLESNTTVKLGAWQIQKWGDKWVAVFSAQIAADTDKDSLGFALQAVTSTADAMEKTLTGKDDY